MTLPGKVERDTRIRIQLDYAIKSILPFSWGM